MIAYLRGTIKYVAENRLIVETNGVGYNVFVTAKTASEAVVGHLIELYIHHQVREDASDLYGVESTDELALFDQLLSVSGVGPKTALNVFGVASIQDIVAAIAHGDASILKKVSGIGGKTAERIILELKNKIGFLEGAGGATFVSKMEQSSAAEEALVSLGYPAQQVRSTLQQLPKEVTDIADQVKWALQQLGR